MKKTLRFTAAIVVLLISIVFSACSWSTTDQGQNDSNKLPEAVYQIAYEGLTLTLPQKIALTFNSSKCNFESADGLQAITITKYEGEDFNYVKLAARIKEQGYNRVFATGSDEFPGVRFEGFLYWACYLTNGTSNYGVIFYDANSTANNNSAAGLCITAVLNSSGVKVLGDRHYANG